MEKKKLWLFILISFFLVLFMAGCGKENNNPNIQLPQVNIQIDPNSTLYLNLNIPGGWEYLTAPSPSRGILVYRLSPDEFIAYERTCTHDPENPLARVQVENSFTTAIDTICGSRYLLIDGSPFEGPSKISLIRYQTYYDGYYLYIYN